MAESITTKRIKEIKGHMSQSEFAESVNSSQSVISKVLSGENPSISLLMDIAKKYNVSVDWLLGLSSKKQLKGNPSPDTNKPLTYADLATLIVKLLENNSISFKREKKENVFDLNFDVAPSSAFIDISVINDHFLGTLIHSANTIMLTSPESIESWLKSIQNDYDIALRNWGFPEESIYNSKIHYYSSLEILKSLSENDNE